MRSVRPPKERTGHTLRFRLRASIQRGVTSNAHAVAQPESLDELATAVGVDLTSHRADHVGERVRRALAAERLATVGALAAPARVCPALCRRFRRAIALLRHRDV